MNDNNYFSSTKAKYETSSVASTVPLTYRLGMWQAIEQLRSLKIDIDYLQVFEFSIQTDTHGIKHQIVEHRQEVPENKRIFEIPIVNDGISDKFFVIDDGLDYVTMLYAEEY